MKDKRKKEVHNLKVDVFAITAIMKIRIIEPFEKLNAIEQL